MTEFRDTVAPFVAGYWTNHWFGAEGPYPVSTTNEVMQFGGFCTCYRFSNKITALATENGAVLFDCHEVDGFPIVVHCNSLYNEVPIVNGGRSSPEVSKTLQASEAQQRINQEFYRRVVLAHIVCLENALRRLAHTSSHIARVETTNDMILCHELGKPWMRGEKAVKWQRPIPKGVLEESFRNLDQILRQPSDLRLFELYELARYRFVDHRFAECVVLAWTACEWMIEEEWAMVVEDIKNNSNDRMPKRRREALQNGATFTASIRSETLELLGRIDFTSYEMLNVLRQKRNRWLHGSSEIEEKWAYHGIKTVERILHKRTGLEISTTTSGAGGEGGGMFVDVFRSRRPDIVLPEGGNRS